MANSYLKRAVSSSGNQKTYTVSAWCKIGNNTGSKTIFSSDVEDDGANYGSLSIEADGLLKFINMTSSSLVTNYQSNRKLLDNTSWYHIVLRVDTTQSTAGDRIRLYVNGEQIVSWAYSTTPAQNTDTGVFKSGNATLIGARHSSSSQNFWDGYLAHVHIVEGQSYAPTVFAENDSTTGEWKPILSPTVTYSADNSAFLKFESSGALGTDSSGQSNDFTVNGNLKQSVSTVSNLFATFNGLHSGSGQQNTISLAGTQIDHANDTYTGKITCATLGMNKGKWYWETKYSTTGGYLSVGFVRNGGLDSSKNIRENKELGDGDDANSWAFKAGNSSGQIVKKIRHNNGDSVADMGVTPAVNDIIQCWLDLDNGKAWWGINGTVMNSGSGTGVPNSGTYPHVTFTVGDEFYIPAVSLFGFNGAPQCQVNFGEGRFGTTAVSSAVADNGGNGSFEYSPLSGFYSICTKNIKDYG